MSRCQICGTDVLTRLDTIHHEAITAESIAAGEHVLVLDPEPREAYDEPVERLVVHAVGWGPDPERTCPGSGDLTTRGPQLQIVPIMGEALTDLTARVRRLERDLSNLRGEVLAEGRRLRGAARVREIIDNAVAWAAQQRR